MYKNLSGKRGGDRKTRGKEKEKERKRERERERKRKRKRKKREKKKRVYKLLSQRVMGKGR